MPYVYNYLKKKLLKFIFPVYLLKQVFGYQSIAQKKLRFGLKIVASKITSFL